MEQQEKKCDTFVLKSGAKGIVLSSSIIEIIFGSVLLLMAVAVAVFAISSLIMVQQWQIDALEFCGIPGVVTVFLIIGCWVMFLSCSIFGILELVVGIKGVKATKNKYTLMNFRSKIWGFAIAYSVILVLYSGFFFSGMPLYLYLVVLVMYLILLSITILKFIGCSKIPTIKPIDTQVLYNKK